MSVSDWKETVEKELVRYQHQYDTDTVTLEELYDFSKSKLISKYPDNDNIEAKIRQQLQNLRDEGKVIFVDNQGTYRIVMNDNNSDLPSLSADIFELLDGTRENSREANDRFKEVTDALGAYLNEIPEFNEFLWSGVGQKAGSPYTSRPHRQPGPDGEVKYWKVCWLGLAHKSYRELYERPQDGLQFQFTIRSETGMARPPAVFSIHLNSGAESELRNEIRTNLKESKDEFLSKLRDLESYQVSLGTDLWSIEEISSNWSEFLSDLDDHFTIFYAMDEQDIESLGSELVPEIATRFEELLPLYSLMSGIHRLSNGEKPNVWIENTAVEGREYKQEGELALGNAIWSPQSAEDGHDRYRMMRKVEPGDIIIHYVRETSSLVGISKVESELDDEFVCPPESEWGRTDEDRPGYRYDLSGYTELKEPIDVPSFLENDDYRDTLEAIKDDHSHLFYISYRDGFRPGQGAYLTRAPDDFVRLLERESSELSDELARLGYELERPAQAGKYDSLNDAVEDIRQRLQLPISEGNQLADHLTRSILSEWTDMLSGFEPDSKISRADEVRGKQILRLFEEVQDDLVGQALLLGVGTLDVLDEGETLFVVMLRDLQEEYDLKTNFNQVKFNVLKRGSYSVHTEEIHQISPSSEPLKPASMPTKGNQIRQLLRENGQVVFYGPPGTGKTYTAQQFARWWLSETTDEATSDQLETVTFHPSFSYEDFVEGLTAQETDDGNVAYEVKPGIFKKIAERARTAYQEHRDNPPPYILIIDEINRGNLSQIFGELITTLEADKRLDAPNEVRISLAHSGHESFTIPPNLYLIGTMNTADRSIALVDAALRRRFRFIHFPPDYGALSEAHGFAGIEEAAIAANEAEDQFRRLIALSIVATQELNSRILTAPDLGKGKQIGHSFLWDAGTVEDIVTVWKFEILPLLEEYLFGQFDRIQEELFAGAGTNLLEIDQEQIRDFSSQDLAIELARIAAIDDTSLPEFRGMEGGG